MCDIPEEQKPQLHHWETLWSSQILCQFLPTNVTFSTLHEAQSWSQQYEANQWLVQKHKKIYDGYQFRTNLLKIMKGYLLEHCHSFMRKNYYCQLLTLSPLI